ncbi:MAG: hypothetical protein ABSH45_09940 [Bryobacteraceae bacterium]
MPLVENAHAAFTNAGWSYRTNERGWVVYRDPRTGLWHTRAEATAIVEAEAISRGRHTPVYNQPLR